SREVEIAPGQTEVLADLEFPPVSESRGRITGPDGEPVADATISFDQGASTHTARSRADGTFTLRLTAPLFHGQVVADGYADAPPDPFLEARDATTEIRVRMERPLPPVQTCTITPATDVSLGRRG